MTEIPDHLLKRSRERRAALGLGGGDDAGGDEGAPAEPSAAAPAAAPAAAAPAAAAPAPAAPAVPVEPIVVERADPPYVAAAKSRKRVPAWVMPVLAFLPVWALLYGAVLDTKEAALTGKLAEGEVIFAKCAACHGATGGGGSGPQLSGGEVLLTFPDMADQIAFVKEGSSKIKGEPYGDPKRPGGQRVADTGGMPAWAGQLTDAEIEAVVCHERVTLSGGDEPSCAEDAAAAGAG